MLIKIIHIKTVKENYFYHNCFLYVGRITLRNKN